MDKVDVFAAELSRLLEARENALVLRRAGIIEKELGRKRTDGVTGIMLGAEIASLHYVRVAVTQALKKAQETA